MRKKIFDVIETRDSKSRLGTFYDCFMMAVIFLSLVPLAFKENNTFFVIVDKVAVTIFIVDYLLRWLTADFRYGKSGFVSFLKYPFSLMAVIDLFSILPSLSVVNSCFKALRVLRLVRTFRVFRVFKAVRYSKNVRIIVNVLRNSKDALIAVCSLAVGYIVISGLVIFNVEPESFDSFFEAIYWATVSLTTMGYGDIYPVTTSGRIITMLSSFIGIAIVALPAGIITAGYMNEIENEKKENT